MTDDELQLLADDLNKPLDELREAYKQAVMLRNADISYYELRGIFIRLEWQEWVDSLHDLAALMDVIAMCNQRICHLYEQAHQNVRMDNLIESMEHMIYAPFSITQEN